MGLTKGSPQPWSSQEDKRLIPLHRAGKPLADIARALGRTYDAVSGKPVRLRLAKTQPQRRRWTRQDIDILKKRYGRLSNRRLAERLGWAMASVGLKARELGIAPPPHRPWTIREDRYLERHYARDRRNQLARKLDRSVAAIGWRLRALGLEPRAKQDAYAHTRAARMEYTCRVPRRLQRAARSRR